MNEDSRHTYPAPPAPVSHLTFRNSRIIYYGPHDCDHCGVLICKMGHQFGGNAFTYPEGPIYPNTEWHPHVCDPRRVAAKPKPCSVPDERPAAPSPNGWRPIESAPTGVFVLVSGGKSTNPGAVEVVIAKRETKHGGWLTAFSGGCYQGAKYWQPLPARGHK